MSLDAGTERDVILLRIQSESKPKFLMFDQTAPGRVRHCKTNLTCNIHLDHELTGRKAAWSFEELQMLHDKACARKSILIVKLTLISS